MFINTLAYRVQGFHNHMVQQKRKILAKESPKSTAKAAPKRPPDRHYKQNTNE